MKRNNRKNLMNIYNDLYEFKYLDSRLECVYCGFPRESVDHIPPLSLVAKIGTKKLRELKVDLITVPCCSFCNNELGARNLGTYEERLHYMYERLQQKIEKETLWSKDDIEELTGNLRRMVITKQLTIKKELLERLRAAENRIVNFKEL